MTSKEDLPKRYKLSFPDSKKLSYEAAKKQLAIDRLINGYAITSQEQAVKAVNKLLYDTATEKGVSLYTLCFHTVPEYGTPELDFEDFKKNQNGDIRHIIHQTITLRPIEFDFEHDGGYWKEKYFALKRKMQELIDEQQES